MDMEEAEVLVALIPKVNKRNKSYKVFIKVFIVVWCGGGGNV